MGVLWPRDQASAPKLAVGRRCARGKDDGRPPPCKSLADARPAGCAGEFSGRAVALREAPQVSPGASRLRASGDVVPRRTPANKPLNLTKPNRGRAAIDRLRRLAVERWLARALSAGTHSVGSHIGSPVCPVSVPWLARKPELPHAPESHRWPRDPPTQSLLRLGPAYAPFSHAPQSRLHSRPLPARAPQAPTLLLLLALGPRVPT